METSQLKRFAQFARRTLIDQTSIRLTLIESEESSVRRQNKSAYQALKEKIAEVGKNQIIEKVSYIWFNRFCAQRFMDMNNYSPIRVVSPANGRFQPEILAEAKKGYIDDNLIPSKSIRQNILDILNGKTPSHNPQGEAYRLLLFATCNYWNRCMPFLFQHINDYTELLMPDDLLSGNSILAYIREAMTPDVCRDVEVLGWLYQHYISEKKDEVFADLKRNKKITPENIPAATQLFTPNWIVRYLVENSLGRLWMLNHPSSNLALQMNYFIKTDEQDKEFLLIDSPEDIKICDPACGSGHMLTYAFDLLYFIYEEQGYATTEIPEKILTKNLFGIEIDERAGELAAFALTMKARSRDSRIFKKKIKPNVCILKNIKFDMGKLGGYLEIVNFEESNQVQHASFALFNQFEETDNFGSLIYPQGFSNPEEILSKLKLMNLDEELLYRDTHQKVLEFFYQYNFLAKKYQVVLANPPYMGARGMNSSLRTWLRNQYPDSYSDLFSAFIDRNLNLAIKDGLVAMITMQSWMFLSSFKKLRQRLFNKETILSMAHFGADAFDSISGHVVMTTAFVLERKKNPGYRGTFLSLVDGKSESAKEEMMRTAMKNDKCGYLFESANYDFQKIPDTPIAYWANHGNLADLFDNDNIKLKHVCEFTGSQNKTGDNEKFLRLHWEISQQSIGRTFKWVPYCKGGGYRKWFGLLIHVADWSDEATRYYNNNPTSNLLSENYQYRSGITYSMLTSNAHSFRILPEGCIYDMKGPSFHPHENYLEVCLLACNTTISKKIFKILNPTLSLQVKDVKNLPIPKFTISQKTKIKDIHESLIYYSKRDWNSFETSMDFRQNPLCNFDDPQVSTLLEERYSNLRMQWKDETNTTRQLETINNKLFISAFGLENTIESQIALEEVSLNCNPYYRYGDGKSDAELEKLLLADTMRELISYAVGCMFGRYAIEKPGLILANQGDHIEEYFNQIPKPIFQPDLNNVIPILDGNWFQDDITERFYKFLSTVFGKENFEMNLQFIEKALNISNKRNFSLRNYFLKQFYIDHVNYFKKRPIYWLFSSPQGSFNALIYIHRYDFDTVSVVLSNYLRELKVKLSSHKEQLEVIIINNTSDPREKTRALTEIEKTNKIIIELEEYEQEVLFPLATQQIEIDLDDGIKANYPKFGKALKKIAGLSKE